MDVNDLMSFMWMFVALCPLSGFLWSDVLCVDVCDLVSFEWMFMILCPLSGCL